MNKKTANLYAREFWTPIICRQNARLIISFLVFSELYTSPNRVCCESVPVKVVYCLFCLSFKYQKFSAGNA